jgi:glycerophosphoryl diester phosphodiesterase
VAAFQIIGHRGAKDEAPENTVAGFQHAMRLGLRAVELDVHLSRDGQLVVIHDDTVDRTTDATGPVSEFTAAELAAMDARAAFPEWPERVGVPTLDQALDALGDMPSIQIEIKRDTRERMECVANAVLGTIRERGIADRVVLSSFERDALAAVARAAPDQARAYIGSFDSEEYLATAKELGCTQVDVSMARGSAELVDRAHREGMRVVGFQCNSAGALEQCLAWSLEAATSDVPSSIILLLPRS